MIDSFLPLTTAIVFLSISANVSLAGDSPSTENLDKKYRALVEQLVSPNPAPTTHVDGQPTKVLFPKNYDVEAQKRMAAARMALYANMREALPYLIDALDDKRYCMTINWADGDGYYNESVGDICREVIASHLEVYRKELNFTGPQHWHHYTYPDISRKWFENRKTRNLAELQLEAIDWAIQRRREEAGRYEREGRKDEVDRLRKMRKALQQSGTALPANGLLPMYTSNRE